MTQIIDLKNEQEQSELEKICQELKNQNKTIVTSNGTFDILHTGHLDSLQRAKAFGEILIVGVNSDSSVREYKGDKRPINSQNDRAALIAGLKCVDYVVIFYEREPSRLLGIIKPNIHVKGEDYRTKTIFERDVVEKNGGIIKLIPLVQDYSTSKIIKKIIEVYGKQT